MLTEIKTCYCAWHLSYRGLTPPHSSKPGLQPTAVRVCLSAPSPSPSLSLSLSLTHTHSSMPVFWGVGGEIKSWGNMGAAVEWCDGLVLYCCLRHWGNVPQNAKSTKSKTYTRLLFLSTLNTKNTKPHLEIASDTRTVEAFLGTLQGVVVQPFQQALLQARVEARLFRQAGVGAGDVRLDASRRQPVPVLRLSQGCKHQLAGGRRRLLVVRWGLGPGRRHCQDGGWGSFGVCCSDDRSFGERQQLAEVTEYSARLVRFSLWLVNEYEWDVIYDGLTELCWATWIACVVGPELQPTARATRLSLPPLIWRGVGNPKSRQQRTSWTVVQKEIKEKKERKKSPLACVCINIKSAGCSPTNESTIHPFNNTEIESNNSPRPFFFMLKNNWYDVWVQCF